MGSKFLLPKVEGYEIPAHKFILAAASPVFFTRFFEVGTGARSSWRAPEVEGRGRCGFFHSWSEDMKMALGVSGAGKCKWKRCVFRKNFSGA